MKILNVTTQLNAETGGGTTERTVQISKHLNRAGVDCSVLTTDLRLTSERINSLHEVKIIPLPCLLGRFFVPRCRLKTIDDLVKNYDLIHLMSHWSVLNAMVYFAARKNDIPYVVCPAGALRIFGRSKNLKRIYNRVVGTSIIRNATRCIAITSNEIPQLEAYGVEEDQVVTIANGVDENEFEDADDSSFRAKFNLDDRPIILFVGRLNEIKGPDLLLNAFSQCEDQLQGYQLVLCGSDCGMLQELQDIVAKHSLKDKVHFLGYVGCGDRSQAFHAAELLVIPSRQEAMSIVVAEAGITGTPVLLTDQCGFNAVDEISGGQVVPASVEGLKNGLLNMLRDKKCLSDMGLNLQTYVRQKHSWPRIVEVYVELYEKLLGEQSL